jgi:hypothetical protein
VHVPGIDLRFRVVETRRLECSAVFYSGSPSHADSYYTTSAFQIREYPWGTCEILNPDHTETETLKKYVLEKHYESIHRAKDEIHRNTIGFLDGRFFRACPCYQSSAMFHPRIGKLRECRLTTCTLGVICFPNASAITDA